MISAFSPPLLLSASVHPRWLSVTGYNHYNHRTLGRLSLPAAHAADLAAWEPQSDLAVCPHPQDETMLQCMAVRAVARWKVLYGIFRKVLLVLVAAFCVTLTSFASSSSAGAAQVSGIDGDKVLPLPLNA